jgi:hypothetical protein
MGNEDEYSLVFDDSSACFFVHHWWSHRKTGSPYDFENGNKDLPLEEFKQSNSWIFNKISERLKQIGFTEQSNM